MPQFIDFADLRKKYPILDVAQKLGIKVRPESSTTHRGQCPFQDCGNIRTFTITPKGGSHGQGICGCFKCGRSGMDSIGLVLKLNGFQRMPDAARHIVELMGGKVTVPEERGFKEASSRSLQPPSSKLDALRKVAEELDPDHERIAALGITSETAVTFVAGYAGRGVARGNVIVQLHDTAGELIGYVGLEEPMWMPKDIQATSHEHVFGWHRIEEGPVKLLASPIEVLRFMELNPDSQAVCFLTPRRSPTQLKYYAELLAQKGCEDDPV